VNDLSDLYQSVILDHNRRPRNFGALEGATASAHGNNPLCGDEVTVWLKVDGDVITDVSFLTPPGKGCAISRASASLMTAAVKGKTRDETRELFERFQQLVTGKLRATTDDPTLKTLAVLSGVARFPVRVKCATLSWHAMRAAMEASHATVSTE
jgi:nitrogen fixation NifU-like protein